jgi:hypothetical protein
LAFTTANKPAVLSGSGDGSDSYRYLLMPVRIGG